MPFSPIREIYTGKSKKIIPNGNDRLLNFADLDCKGESTQHATHALHPYIAAINPPLSRKLIETYVPADQSVLDPFCGGGGVLVESILSGRRCAGFDINPLGTLISESKTTWLDRTEIEKEYANIKARMKNKRKSEWKISEAGRYWFREDSLPNLAILSNAVRECEGEEIKNLFKVILSATVRSSMLTYRGEVRLRKLRGKDFENFHPNPFQIFENRYKAALGQISALPKKCSALIKTEDSSNSNFDLFLLRSSPRINNLSVKSIR